MPEMSDDQQMGDEERPVPDKPVRQFGWSNMFVHPDEDPRSEGGSPTNEPSSSSTCTTSG
jgi:hypothetical protein